MSNHQITPDAAVNWLREAQRYFSKRPTNGEDRAHWSNVYNAENAGKIADLIASLRRERDDALRAAWAVRDLATTPISDEDVARAIEEAMRVRPAIARKQADRISSLEAENRRMREALQWYGEQARLARIIHSEGDKGRHALADDGGQRARAALSQEESRARA